MMKWVCWVLWRKRIMPRYAPKAPPAAALIRSALSGILHFFFFDLYLSIPYIQRLITLIMISQMIRSVFCALQLSIIDVFLFFNKCACIHAH